MKKLKMKKLKMICITLVFIVFSISCASVLTNNVQKIEIATNNLQSKVFINDVEQGVGKSVVSNIKKDFSVQQVKIVTEGFKDQYLVCNQKTNSPLIVVNSLPVNYKSETDKFVFVKNAFCSVDIRQIKTTKINYDGTKSKTEKEKFVDSIINNVKFDNHDFTHSLNNILVKYHFTDTTNTVFKNKANSAYVTANISSINLQPVYQKVGKYSLPFMRAETTINWDFMDIYGQIIYTKRTTYKSGDFSFDYYKEKIVATVIEDAVTNSFLNFMNEKKVKDNMKKSKFGLEPKYKTLELFKGDSVTNLDEALNSTVTIKAKNGYGTGFKVGKDGYLITNYHVVANSQDRITVITKDNKEYSGKLIRKSEALDLALIQVDAVFENHFKIDNVGGFNKGEGVFLIGAKKALDQEQSVLQRVVFGYKEKEGFKFIETDASIDEVNSGSPMINKDGKLIGIVNPRFNGGSSNLGYAVPSEFLISSLYIK